MELSRKPLVEILKLDPSLVELGREVGDEDAIPEQNEKDSSKPDEEGQQTSADDNVISDDPGLNQLSSREIDIDDESQDRQDDNDADNSADMEIVSDDDVDELEH